jgi:hypothetical protein
MAFARVLGTAPANSLDFSSEPGNLRSHNLMVVLEFRAIRINPRFDPFHCSFTGLFANKRGLRRARR